MTKINNVSVTCPNCQTPGTYTHYASVNVTLDPSLKEKVLDQSLFVYACESCNAHVNVDVETLYHDMQQQLLIYLLPNDENPLQTALESFELLAKAGQNLPFRESYTLRVVSSVFSLTDKIRAFDDDLNDGLLEAAKIAIQNQENSLLDTTLYYTHTEDEDDQKLLAFSVFLNDQWQGLRVPFNLYEAMEHAFPHVRSAIENGTGTVLHVDPAWTADQMLSQLPQD